MNVNVLQLNLKYIHHILYLIPSFITFKCLQKHEPNFVAFNNHIRISASVMIVWFTITPLLPFIILHCSLLYANKLNMLILYGNLLRQQK